MPAESKFPGLQYLRVIGRLHADLRLQLRSGYLSDTVPRFQRQEADEHGLTAETFDATGQSLGRFSLNLSPTCSGEGSSPTLAVRGWVPFHPEAAGVRYLYRGRILEEIRRCPEPPSIKLLWQPSERVTGKQLVQWDSLHREDGMRSPRFFLRYTCNGGERWQRLSLQTSERSLEIDFDGLPGGRACMVALVATDGIDTTVVRTPPFQVQVKPLIVTIVSPADGTEKRFGEDVMCMGSAFSMEDNSFETQSLTWSSSLDGELGNGPTLTVAHLSEGVHYISLNAGVGERQGHAEVSLRIRKRNQTMSAGGPTNEAR